MIRLGIAEDHTIVRWALREALGKAEDIEVVGEPGSAAETLEMVKRERPDALLLDISLPDRSGFDIVEELTALGIAVVLISTRAIEDHADRLASCSASGFLGKDVLSGDAVRALVASQQ